MSEQAILRMEGIHKSFGATHALRGVDLSVIRGKVNAVVGSNGAGKSTLMKTLAGIYQPDEGHVYFEEEDITGLSPMQLQRMGIQVVHQVLNIVGSMTVLENILLANPPVSGGVLRWKQGAKTVREVLRRIDFPLELDLPVRSLSVSEQQFVILARALIHRPRLLVLDEPTARLGMEETQKLFGLIRRLKEQGTTLIYISHRLDEIYAISDRICVFRDGLHVISRDTEAFSEAELVQAMLGKKMDTFFPKADAPVGETLLSIEGLTLRGRLRGIDLTVRSGEIVSLVGAVGAGKTEILDCLFGSRKADGGTVRLRGTPVRGGYGIGRAIRNGFAMVPEDRALQGMLGDWSVKENLTSVEMKKASRGPVLNRGVENREAEKLVTLLDVRPHDIDYRMTGLSGGNQQKVVIGKWLTRDYPLYLMDEVTAGVDIQAKAAIYELMGRVVKRGGAVLLATGDIEEALGVSDRIMVLYKGRIVFEASPDSVTKARLLGYIMGGGASA
ncbi:MAG: sugar ABC transporter ATP-binding protein [Clostridiales bacterium]|nr:sugar ABC transporter ATP-binding protein [Clostridiales bacterium]